MRHSGVAITSGERYLLVGFIGCMPHPYAMRGPRWQLDAEREGFLKFGEGAWRREAAASRPRLVEPQKEEKVVVAAAAKPPVAVRYVPVD